MEKSFRDLYDILQKSRQDCPWASKLTVSSILLEAESEIRELREAVEKNDTANMAEECGDLLMDILTLAIIAEEKGMFTVSDVFLEAAAKMKRRKPWLVSGKKVTLDEAKRIWREEKAREKQNGSKEKK